MTFESCLSARSIVDFNIGEPSARLGVYVFYRDLRLTKVKLLCGVNIVRRLIRLIGHPSLV